MNGTQTRVKQRRPIVTNRYEIVFADGTRRIMSVHWYSAHEPGPSIPEQLGDDYAKVVRMYDLN